jgi:hypothetical protein
MSVRSEFNRMLRGCTDLLDASDAPAAGRLASSLLAAGAISTSDLSEAASRVLALAERAEPLAEIEFGNPVDRDILRKRVDHLLAISRAILGRPQEG